jgi:hypothetical protein
VRSWGKKKTYTIPGRTIELRSGFEAKVAEYLDERNVKWEYETMSVPLEKAGTRGLVCGACGSKDIRGKTKYTPDFFIPMQDGSGITGIVEC